MFGKRKRMEMNDAEPEQKLTLRQKAARLRKSLSDLCVTVRTNYDVSFRRNPDAAPGKTYRFGSDRTYKVGSLILIALSAAAAFAAGVLAVRAVFDVAVSIASKKASRRK